MHHASIWDLRSCISIVYDLDGLLLKLNALPDSMTSILKGCGKSSSVKSFILLKNRYYFTYANKSCYLFLWRINGVLQKSVLRVVLLFMLMRCFVSLVNYTQKLTTYNTAFMLIGEENVHTSCGICCCIQSCDHTDRGKKWSQRPNKLQ